MNLIQAAHWLFMATLKMVNACERTRRMVAAAIAKFQALVLIAKVAA